MSNENQISLKIGGKSFYGWKSIEVTQSMNKFSGAFAMSYTDKFPSLINSVSFKIGDECTVDINDQRLITGYVDEIDTSYNSSSHELQVRGRDKLGDLIDCSNWGTKARKEFVDQTVYSIVKALCLPFSISVVVDSSASVAAAKKPASPWKTKEGDTVFDSIIDLCRTNALLPISYGDGKLTLTLTSSNKAYDKIKLGTNVLSCNLSQSNIERFSDYIVKGSGKALSDLDDLETVNQSYAHQSDTLINRHRPLIIISNDVVADINQLEHQAKWEAATRAGNSRKYQYVLHGWLQSNGEKWSLNSLVMVVDSINKIEDTFLITDVSFVLSQQGGKTTQLTLMHPDAFKLISLPSKIKTKFDLSSLTISE
jgi:prophage tail gpP-like protein